MDCVLVEKSGCEDGKIEWEDGRRRGFMAGTRQDECQSRRMNFELAYINKTKQTSRITIVSCGHSNNSKLAVAVTCKQLRAGMHRQQRRRKITAGIPLQVDVNY